MALSLNQIELSSIALRRSTLDVAYQYPWNWYMKVAINIPSSILNKAYQLLEKDLNQMLKLNYLSLKMRNKNVK